MPLPKPKPCHTGIDTRKAEDHKGWQLKTHVVQSVAPFDASLMVVLFTLNLPLELH